MQLHAEWVLICFVIQRSAERGIQIYEKWLFLNIFIHSGHFPHVFGYVK